MLSIPIWCIMKAVFAVSVFPDLGIHISANDQYVVFRKSAH